MTPIEVTSAPTEQMPATSAASSILEEMRVSRPMSSIGFSLVWRVSTVAAARPICIARSQVRSVLATPLSLIHIYTDRHDEGELDPLLGD